MQEREFFALKRHKVVQKIATETNVVFVDTTREVFIHQNSIVNVFEIDLGSVLSTLRLG